MKRFIAIYSVVLMSLASLWATPNTLYFMEYLPYQSTMNPAFQPRCTTYVELPAISTISLYGNTGGLTLNDFVYVKDGNLVTFLHPEFGNKEAVYSKLMKSNGVDTELDVSLFGFGFKVKEKGYLTINASLRANATLGMPSDIVTLGMYGTQDTVNVNSYSLDVPLSINTYLDLSGGYSHKINDKWTVGGRLHLLYGIANAQLKSEDLILNLSQQEWSLSGNFKGNVSIPGVKFITDENGEVKEIRSTSLLKSLDCSIGASVDLGALYKPIPELTVSLSVKDLGFIVWNTNATKVNGNLDYVFKGLSIDIDDETDETTIEPNGTISAAESLYTTMMNGKIYAGVEYSFLKNMMSVGVVSKTSYNYSHWDEEVTLGYNLRPCSWFGLSATYSFISSGFNTLGLGLNLRLPPLSFYVASDYTPLHYTADGIPYKTSAFNVQAGLVLTMGCKKKKPVEETPEDVLPEPAPASAEVTEPVAEESTASPAEAPVEVTEPAPAEVSEPAAEVSTETSTEIPAEATVEKLESVPAEVAAPAPVEVATPAEEVQAPTE
jgi:hypothetical protein